MPWSKFILPDDWDAIFALDTPLLEVFIRITVVYFFLVLVLRVTLKREAGGTSLRDLLVLVLIADAVQNGMAGEYKSVGGALVIAGTIIFWAYILDWAGYRFPGLRRFLNPAPLELIRDGRVLAPNLGQEFITQEELLAQLGQQGVERPEEVRLAVMESDGRISVLPWEPDRHQRPRERPET